MYAKERTSKGFFTNCSGCFNSMYYIMLFESIVMPTILIPLIPSQHIRIHLVLIRFYVLKSIEDWAARNPQRSHVSEPSFLSWLGCVRKDVNFGWREHIFTLNNVTKRSTMIYKWKWYVTKMKLNDKYEVKWLVKFPCKHSWKLNEVDPSGKIPGN